MRHEGVQSQRMRVPPGEFTVRPGSYPDGIGGADPVGAEAPETKDHERWASKHTGRNASES